MGNEGQSRGFSRRAAMERASPSRRISESFPIADLRYLPIWRRGRWDGVGTREKGRTHGHLDAAGGLAADGHVEEADGVGHFDVLGV